MFHRVVYTRKYEKYISSSTNNAISTTIRKPHVQKKSQCQLDVDAVAKTSKTCITTKTLYHYFNRLNTCNVVHHDHRQINIEHTDVPGMLHVTHLPLRVLLCDNTDIIHLLRYAKRCGVEGLTDNMSPGYRGVHHPQQS